MESASLNCSDNHQQRTCHNAEIRKIKHNTPEPLPFHIETEIIHHILPLQPIICIAESASKQKSQSHTHQVISPVPKAEQEYHCHQYRQHHGQRRHHSAAVLPPVEYETSIMMPSYQNASTYTFLYSVFFYFVFHPQIAEKNNQNNQHTRPIYHFIPRLPQVLLHCFVDVSFYSVSPSAKETNPLFSHWPIHSAGFTISHKSSSSLETSIGFAI